MFTGEKIDDPLAMYAGDIMTVSILKLLCVLFFFFFFISKVIQLWLKGETVSGQSSDLKWSEKELQD